VHIKLSLLATPVLQRIFNFFPQIHYVCEQILVLTESSVGVLSRNTQFFRQHLIYMKLHSCRSHHPIYLFHFIFNGSTVKELFYLFGLFFSCDSTVSCQLSTHFAPHLLLRTYPAGRT